MPWPDHIVEKFNLIGPRGEYDESRFYGPINVLLNYLFPSEEHFMVTPQYKRPEQAKSADFTTIFTISHGEHPVLFLEVKPSGHLQLPSARAAADIQMRERFKVIFDSVRIPKLYGLSALGTKFCVYTLDTTSGELLPEPIPDNPTRLKDTAPMARWDYDIITSQGEDIVRRIAAEVKELCGRDLSV